MGQKQPEVMSKQHKRIGEQRDKDPRFDFQERAIWTFSSCLCNISHKTITVMASACLCRRVSAPLFLYAHDLIWMSTKRYGVAKVENVRLQVHQLWVLG